MPTATSSRGGCELDEIYCVPGPFDSDISKVEAQVKVSAKLMQRVSGVLKA